MDPRYPQLKQFVVQTVQKRNMTYGAFNEAHARMLAALDGHRVVRIMTLEDFEKHQDAYFMGQADGYESGFAAGHEHGFSKGYQYRATLEQREEEEIAERVSQITVAQKAKWEGRI